MFATIALALLTLILAGVAVVMAMRAALLGKKLRDASEQIQITRGNNGALVKQLEQATAEDKTKADWLDNMEQEMNHLRRELEKRPKLTRKTYKILTLGIKATGKTSLTIKWANPLVN